MICVAAAQCLADPAGVRAYGELLTKPGRIWRAVSMSAGSSTMTRCRAPAQACWARPPLADKGYRGSTWAKIPYRGRNKPASQKEANRAHAKLRAPGERANAQLKTWKILTKLRCCPWRAGQLAKAIHVLQIRGA